MSYEECTRQRELGSLVPRAEATEAPGLEQAEKCPRLGVADDPC